MLDTENKRLDSRKRLDNDMEKLYMDQMRQEIKRGRLYRKNGLVT
jgi:hypothetical protein